MNETIKKKMNVREHAVDFTYEDYVSVSMDERSNVDDANPSPLQSNTPSVSNMGDVVTTRKHLSTLQSNFAATDASYLQCPSCKRNFIQDQFKKHFQICKKVFQTKRKPFNMKDIRCKFLKDKLNTTAEEFNKFGGGIKIKPKSSLSAEDARLEKHPATKTCHVCGRNFNYESAIKHIKVCEENALRNKFKAKNAASDASKRTVSRNLPVQSSFSRPPIAGKDKKENIFPKPVSNDKLKRMSEQISVSNSTIVSNTMLRKPTSSVDRSALPKPTSSIAFRPPLTRGPSKPPVAPVPTRTTRISKTTDRSLTRGISSTRR